MQISTVEHYHQVKIKCFSINLHSCRGLLESLALWDNDVALSETQIDEWVNDKLFSHSVLMKIKFLSYI